MLKELLLKIADQSGTSDRALCEQTLNEALSQHTSPIHALLDKKVVPEALFLKNLASNIGLSWWDFQKQGGKFADSERFPLSVAVRHTLVPLEVENGVEIVTCDPFDILGRERVAQIFPQKLKWSISSREDIQKKLRDSYGIGADTFQEILEGRQNLSELDLRQETTNLNEDDSEASITKFVNQLLREALIQRATDIHIEPLDDDLRVRYRIDGMLHSVPIPHQIKLLQAMLISRVKIMAHLDIAERRLPQDGRINLEMDGDAIDVRVATIPSVSGESISLRLLRQRKFDLHQVGFDDPSVKAVRELLTLPNGIILLTGPTGCGKSTTLYAFLSSLNTDQRRIVTIEDPVEYKLQGVVQIAVKPEIGLTFASGLRTILRGDPNVVMIGEMRDLETAETAIRAALTGHLVFSTLHTNDAIGGITRLIDLGLEPFLVASAVRAFLAQRLVRVLCPHCKKPATYPREYLDQISYPPDSTATIYEANGCEHCRGTGYEGRTAIIEICRITAAMQELISQNRPINEIKPLALKEGMVPLRQAGFNMVQKGITTIEEVLRVTMIDAAKGEVS